MITINEAFSILQSTNLPLKEVEVPLFEALNCVLAQTVHAPISLPPFRQSNMDGFALALHDGLNYQIVGEVKAGDIYGAILKPGQAVKIFTGAAVPDSAHAVIQIEKGTVTNDQL